MTKFVINGGKKLKGKIRVSGMKNAATPIIASTLLTSQECVLENTPRITDVLRMLQILESLGAKVVWKGKHTVSIRCNNVSLKSLDKKTVKSMRSSVLFMGSMLARFHRVDLPEPGGCIIGNRPLGAHFRALESLGAVVETRHGASIRATKLKGANIILPEFSVTATENALMASALAQGETIIKLSAMEPHVQDLISFLNKMGARISEIGAHTLKIRGVKKLHGAKHKIIPDQIEAGTFAVAAVATRGEVEIQNIIPGHLDRILLAFQDIGVNFVLSKKSLLIKPSKDLRAFNIQTLPYPGFPTDLQAPFGVLATQCKGTSLIHDPMYEGRMGYIKELEKMGAKAKVCDPHRVLITGPSQLFGRKIKSLDLRAGATMVIAGLVAKGETIINNAEILDRGYEELDKRFRKLGANIKRVV
ncbi:MAG: UDP-N-acetylglucosamine 1-carboxyvinyltransferase [Patescibacteria group bacterium]|nr:UDP-N-acetylglucosamine 1-carboxyvinyltransferase [Patescibacteria group bacterium]